MDERHHESPTRALALAILLGCISGPAWAQKAAPAGASAKGPPPQAAPADPAWTALEREFALAWQTHQAALVELQAQKVDPAKWPAGPVGDYWERCEAFADRGELGAVRWCIAYSEALALSPPERNQLRGELYGKWAKDLPEGPALKDLLRSLQSESRPDRLGLAPTSALLAKIADRVQDRSLRSEARAMRSLAHLTAGGPANVQVARESLALAIEDDPKNVTATKVRGRLFQLDHLQVGMTCPDFTAKDVDGVEFKLSDYRGKVVVLDFWGFW